MLYRILCVLLFIAMAPSANALIILKTKEKKALIYLQGVRVPKGSYHRIYDLDGNKRGILKIDRVAHTKAIGTLKVGRMAKKWRIQPLSNKTAMLEMKRSIAERKKRVLKRRQRLAKLRKAMEKRRRLQAKRKALKRKIASFELEEDVLEGLEHFDQQSSEVLSYEDKEESSKPKTAIAQAVEVNIPVVSLSPAKRDKDFNFSIGLYPSSQYKFVQVSPGTGPKYTMKGLSYGGAVRFSASLNSYLDFGFFGGARYFYVSAEDKQCGQEEGCSLRFDYLLTGMDLNLNVLQFKQHQLFIEGKGNLLFPLRVANKTPKLKSNFYPFQGSVGAGFGVRLSFGRFLIPISAGVDVYMPPTKTVLVWGPELQLGLSYQF